MPHTASKAKEAASMTFFGYKNTLRISSATLALIGSPSHVGFAYCKEQKTLWLIPCDENDLDAGEITKKGDHYELRVPRFFRLIYGIANWNSRLTYNVIGVHIPSRNTLWFDLKQYDILWRNKKIFKLV